MTDSLQRRRAPGLPQQDKKPVLTGPVLAPCPGEARTCVGPDPASGGLWPAQPCDSRCVRASFPFPNLPAARARLLVQAYTGPPGPRGQHHSASSAYFLHSLVPRQGPSGATSSRPCLAGAPRPRLSSPLSPGSGGSIPESSHPKGREITGEARPLSRGQAACFTRTICALRSLGTVTRTGLPSPPPPLP